jgi:hypothetical protein
MEDAQRVEIMTKLSTVDKEWTDRPEVEMRRMVEVPWLIDQTAPTSAIFDILREDPVIGVDVRTSIDDSAIIIWRDPINSIPEAARVPIGRANLLLGVAAQGRLSSEYVRILPQPKEHTTPVSSL